MGLLTMAHLRHAGASQVGALYVVFFQRGADHPGEGLNPGERVRAAGGINTFRVIPMGLLTMGNFAHAGAVRRLR